MLPALLWDASLEEVSQAVGREEARGGGWAGLGFLSTAVSKKGSWVPQGPREGEGAPVAVRASVWEVL